MQIVVYIIVLSKNLHATYSAEGMRISVLSAIPAIIFHQHEKSTNSFL